MAYGLEIEPGALIAVTDLGDDFGSETFKVVETLHGANYVVEFTASSILDCTLGVDPHFSDTVLLLGFEGSNGSTGAPGMTDESFAAHGNAEVLGDAAISTAQFDTGTSSLSLSGVSPTSVRFEDSDDWTLSSSNSDEFTIECSVYFTAIGTDDVLIAQYFISPSIAWGLQTDTNPTDEFQFRFSTDGAAFEDVVSSGAALTTGVWYRLAVDKDATGKIRLYKDGTMVGSATPADSSILNIADAITIGATASGTKNMTGFMDEIRITKGVARYASDGGYAVSVPFPRS